MLIYGNTPKDILKMGFRNKTKFLLLVGAVVLAVSMVSSRADADEHEDTKTNKVVTHIQAEIQDIKEYQIKSWAGARAQWLALKTKFLSN